MTFSRIFARQLIKGVKILVITETDACCGPMAAAFLRDYSPLLEVVSVGRNPVQSVEPMVITAMHECLVDLQDYVPRDLKSVEALDFDVVYECPDVLCPTTIETCRELRDCIKNEAFLFFKGL